MELARLARTFVGDSFLKVMQSQKSHRGTILGAGVPQPLCAYNKSNVGRDAGEV